MKKPVGYDQFVRAFNSGGAGGGNATATDGETVWSFCNEGGMKYVYRADGKSFGVSHGANRSNGYLPRGWVTSMAAWRDGEHAFVAVAQRGKIVISEEHKDQYVESKTEFVDTITLHDGVDGKVLAVPIDKKCSLYTHWQKPEDMNPLRLKTISHFFEHYKDLEEGKWVKVIGWQGPEAAHKEIADGIAAYIKP